MLNTPQTINQAIRLNNAAVHQTAAGCNPERAIAHLYQALALISESGRQASSDDGSSPLCLIGTNLRLPSLNESSDFLFQSLITFSVPKTRNYDNLALCRVLAAGILFNIAIVFHRRALAVSTKRQQKRDFLYKTAEAFYKKALKVVPVCATTENRTNCVAIMVKLAAVNNISLIRRRRGASPHEDMNEALQLVFRQLINRPPSGSTKSGSLLDTVELRGILSNMTRR